MKRRSGTTPSQVSLGRKIFRGIGVTILGVTLAALLHEFTVPDPAKAPEEITTDPKVGDILIFYRPRWAFDYLIRLVTRSAFFHVALYAGDNMAVEARTNGVHQNSLEGREVGYLVIPAPEGKGEAALAWAKTQIGDGYDRKGAFILALEHVFTKLHINYTTPDKYTCGEFVTKAFEEAGFKAFPGQETEDIAPVDWARYLPEPYNKKYGPKPAKEFTLDIVKENAKSVLDKPGKPR